VSIKDFVGFVCLFYKDNAWEQFRQDNDPQKKYSFYPRATFRGSYIHFLNVPLQKYSEGINVSFHKEKKEKNVGFIFFLSCTGHFRPLR